MYAPGMHPLTPSRIVSLALILITVAVLALLRLSAGPEAVRVPTGARSGDLTLVHCTFATEVGPYDADCGTLVVPENRANPTSRLIALPVIRVRAQSANPAEPIFRLFGGPGLSNMRFPQASRLADQHDIVLVGYRGIDGSVRLDCHEVEALLRHATDLVSVPSDAFGSAFRACADRLTTEGVDLEGYGLAQRVDDLEAARVALGYDRINLLSSSVGTRTALLYAWRFPERIHRSAMIAPNPPGHFLWDPVTIDEQIARYADLCAQDASCGARTNDFASSMRRVSAEMPDRWLFLPIREGNVRLGTFYGLMESTAQSAPLNAPMTIDSWLAATEGDASGLWLLSVMSGLVIPRSFVWGEYAASGTLDAEAAHKYFASARPSGSLGDTATTFSWAGGLLGESWPATEDRDEYSRPRTTNVPTLLISGEVDFATPPQGATTDLLPYLPNGHQVILRGFGHSQTFWAEQPAAGVRLLNNFYDSGQVDDSLYTPHQVDFTPSTTQAALAKRIAGVMIGAAVVTVASLLGLAIRLATGRRLGRKAGVAIRSAHSLLIGLGGWTLGALLALATMPGVPLDDELLTVLSVGAPVGLGGWLAWISRDTTDRSVMVGLAAAMGSGLVGSWMGFHTIDGVFAILTTTVGATAAANLMLTILDIGRDQQMSAPTLDANLVGHSKRGQLEGDAAHSLKITQ